MTTLHIITGEGIECEKESERFFKLPLFEFENVLRAPLPKILAQTEAFFAALKARDWIFFPGGFSFADHFGSGRLLAHTLKEIHFFERALQARVHLMGVCNGFQVLAHSGLLGQDCALLHNVNPKNQASMGFVNRWVTFKHATLGSLRLPVRHGEGRLQWSSGSRDLRPFLHYDDPDFNNGSLQNVAGLVGWHGASSVWGLMPHPEIAMRLADQPDFGGPDYDEQFRDRNFELRGDGVKLVKMIFEEVSGHA